MLRKLKIALFFFFLLLNFSFNISAQGRYKSPMNFLIKGRVVANKSKLPLRGCSILVRDLDSTSYRETITDSLGFFSLELSKRSQFILEISSIGYSLLSTPLSIDTSKAKPFDVGVFELQEIDNLLEEVVVSGNKNIMQNQMGKIAINVHHKIFASSSTAFDLVQKIPGIIYSNDKLFINGNVVPDITINGRRTTISIDELKTIPYESIEKIEVINNPTARFEGDRKAIINIILKKRAQEESYKVTVFSEYSRNKYNTISMGSDLEVVKKKYSVNLSAGYLNVPSFVEMYNKRKYSENGATRDLEINSFIKNKPIFYYYNGQIEYAIDTSNTFNLSYRGVTSKVNQYPNGRSDLFIDGQKLSKSISTIGNSLVNSSNSTITFEYQHLFKNPKTKISLEGNYGIYNLNQDQKTTNFDLNRPGQNDGVLSDAESKVKLGNFNIDFETTFFSGGLLQIGAKYNDSYTKNTLYKDSIKNDLIIKDAGSFDDFRYREKVYASYVDLFYPFELFNLSAGLRTEFTRATGKSFSEEDFVNSFNNFLPNIQLFKKFNNNNTLTISYSKKITRPSYQDLNPFVFIIDTYTQVSGNPRLGPSDYSNYRIDYSINKVNIGVGYRDQQKLITQVPLYDPLINVITYSFQNIDVKRNFSLDIAFPIKVTKWWEIQNSSTILYDDYSTNLDGSNIRRHRFNFRNNVVNMFTLFKSWQLNAVFFYSSPSVYNVYTVRPMSAFDVGINKKFANGRGNLKINFNDIFRGRKNELTVNYFNMNNTLHQTNSSRNVSVRVSYSFGGEKSSTSKIIKKRDNESNRIKNSLN